MVRRLLRADLAASPVVAMTLTALIALAAALASASTWLIVDTTAATNRLAERARVPDLIQMHTGDADPAAIEAWADGRSDILEHEIITTLPVPRHELWIDGANQADSYYEPAFVTAPTRIDLLLDDHGEPADPGPGEVFLPIHYQAAGLAEVGDTITVESQGRRMDLEVVGFVRDAQMNAPMVPSKRLVVSAQDFSALAESITEPEYLIEFDLADSARPGTVTEAYKAAGLPATGISIDGSMISLINALSTMLIAAVALVVALVLAVVAMLALRYTVLAAIEADLPQIAVLKAIGAPQGRIRRLYALKYTALALIGSAVGYAAAIPLAGALEAPAVLYLGEPPTTVWSLGLPLASALVLAGTIIGFTLATLRRVGRISAVEALRSGTSGALRRRRHRWRLSSSRRLPVQLWLGMREALRPSNALLMGVLTLCTFTMVLPVNVATTLDDPRIATYLGSGQSDLRIDVRAGVQDIGAVEDRVASDPRISRHTTVLRRQYTMEISGGQWEPVLIDIGDHTAFPMTYLSGRAPTGPQEISLSYNQAQASGAQVGSTVTITTAEGERSLSVTGIYQDITNNGLTAKATFDDGAPALWQLIYADLGEGQQEQAVVEDLGSGLEGVQVTAMSQYASQFFGATGSQVRLIATMACIIALGLSFLITVLFAVLVLARERAAVGVLRALGCTHRAIAVQYLTRFGALALMGLAVGMTLAFTLGETAIGAVLGSRGAPTVELLADPWLVGLVLPAALVAAVTGAVVLALSRARVSSPL
ncbi:FtsX-like permease family protein [Actinomyces bowdenii]|uniref:ABC transporter permease n=1 Tax=Actinomyces bowdenii TaxID=131109 RepID=A0A3P1V874_9ACTO|nr:FtsX-like permease family protein [Actinomyces bowdenii]RRD29988.1 ABC transporter permease [Actinomyces bowdenii]